MCGWPFSKKKKKNQPFWHCLSLSLSLVEWFSGWQRRGARTRLLGGLRSGFPRSCDQQGVVTGGTVPLICPETARPLPAGAPLQLCVVHRLDVDRQCFCCGGKTAPAAVRLPLGSPAPSHALRHWADMNSWNIQFTRVIDAVVLSDRHLYTPVVCRGSCRLRNKTTGTALKRTP